MTHSGSSVKCASVVMVFFIVGWIDLWVPARLDHKE